MSRRDVECLKVVPLVLDLGTAGSREAQPAHDLLQVLDRLRDGVQVAQPHGRSGERRVEGRPARRRARSLDRGMLYPLLRGDEGGFQRFLDLVESLAGGRFVPLVDAGQPLLDVLQATAFRTEKLDACRFERMRASGAREGILGVPQEPFEFRQEFSQCHS